MVECKIPGHIAYELECQSAENTPDLNIVTFENGNFAEEEVLSYGSDICHTGPENRPPADQMPAYWQREIPLPC